MGADISAVVALDALGSVPGRNVHGNAALLISGSAQLELAVHVLDESGHGQRIAIHLVHGVQDGLDLLHQSGGAFQNGVVFHVLGVRPVGGHVELLEGGGAGVDGLVVHIHHVLALLQVGVRGGVLHVLDGICLRQNLGQREEGRLQDGVGALAHTDLGSQVDGVDGVNLDVVLGNVTLGSSVQLLTQLLVVPLAVDEEGAAGLDVADDGEALGDVGGHVAGHEVSLVDVVRRLDGLVAEAQVADGHAAGLLGVILEVCLNILVGMVADDLDGVLVGADGTIAAQAPELALDGALGSHAGSGLLLQAEVRDIIHDADGELTLHLVLVQLVIDSEHGSRRGILGTQTVTAADNLDVGLAGVGQSGDNIHVQRLALCAGLLGAVQHGDLLAGSGDGSQQLVRTERTIQVNLHHADLLAVSGHVVDDLLGHVADGTHGDDHALSVGSTIVVEELIVGAQLLVDLAHVLLHHIGQSVVVGVAGLTMLEEDIAVLVRAAHVGALGVQGVLAERGNGVHIAHFLQIVVIPHGNLLDLVRGPETVEEVDEGNTALDSSQMGHGSQVHDLLGIILAQHGEAGLTAGHDIGVIAEDVQGVSGDRTGGHVEHAGQQLAGDLVHVGDHQQQALRSRVGGGHCTGGQRAVDGTGSTGLRLHLDNLDGGAEDVLLTSSSPLIDQVCHGRGRGDRIDARHFGKCVADICSGIVTVHGLELSCHKLTSYIL
ncbi:putative uncharacterized protein [Oscillibacter sp. CAG:155]|nr:putative uncharacterized protein [Oscillibacter sp. CAG:155]